MTLKICPQGHHYHKSSDCPTCPVCEEQRKPKNGFLSTLGAPARRALEKHQILAIEELAAYTEKEILQFHGIGKSSIPKLKSALQQAVLQFKI